MEKTDQTLKPNKLEPSMRSNKLSYRNWILTELVKIALLLGEEVTRERIDLTVDELLAIEPYHLSIAFATARQECKFFPRPAEILEFVKREKSKIRILERPGGDID
jgi:hypothetical protein